jgi:hypothetical protein
MPNIYPPGQCTWWCAEVEPWCLRYGNLGNAESWAGNWGAHGGSLSRSPKVSDVACFQPGVDGALGLGHVAVVIGVGANTFTVTEMHAPRLGVVDTRTYALMPGISFLVQSAPTPPPPSPPTEELPDMLYLFNTGALGIWCLYWGKYFHVTPDDLAAFEAIMAKPIQTIGADGHAVLLATYP